MFNRYEQNNEIMESERERKKKNNSEKCCVKVIQINNKNNNHSHRRLALITGLIYASECVKKRNRIKQNLN